MSRLTKAAIALGVAAVAVTPFIIFSNNSGAEASAYMDFSQISSVLDSSYASSRIYRKENTQTIVKRDGGDNSRAGEAFTGAYNVEPGNKFVLLITDSSAKDSNGNPVDVVWTVDNVRYWEPKDATTGESITVDNHYFQISLDPTICGSTKTVPTEEDCVPVSYGVNDPIAFWLNTFFADADFTVQYIVKGSFNDSSLTGTPAGINKLTLVSYDLDVPSANYTGAQYLESNEGVRVEPTSRGKTTFYYNKNAVATGPRMIEKDNGIAIKTLGEDGYTAAFNGIYWGTSFFAVANNLSNSKYTFKYSATTAGTSYFFGSPVAYDTTAPTKYVEEEGQTENRVTTNGFFDYIIKQQIPENFSTSNDILGFASLYSKYNNIKTDHNYANFSIHDNIDANLILPKYTDVKIYNGSTDVTSKFNTVISGQDITVSAKADYLANPEFYGTTLKVVIPVTAKNVLAAKEIPNQATNSYTYTGTGTYRKTSNTTTTKVFHKLTVRYIDKETGKEISDTKIVEYNHGDEYTTETASDLPTGYQLIEVPENATGIINSDITVIYYYNIPKNPSTIDRDLIPFALTLASTAVVALGLFYVASKRR